MSFATVAANLTVIAVFIVNPKLRNSQYYYKLSLATADLIVGAITFNSMIIFCLQNLATARLESDSYNPAPDNQTYINFLGFTTSVSLLASVFTLMSASYDRFMAISEPLWYNIHRALHRARIILVIVWTMSSLLASIPVYFLNIQYYKETINLVVSNGVGGRILSLVSLLVPMCLMWVIAWMTYTVSKKHKRTGRDARVTEARLVTTLVLMIGVFTLCFLPTLTIMVTRLSTDWSSGTQHNCPSNNHKNKTLKSVEYVSTFILLSNSLWNCFIYSGRNQVFRKSALNLYKSLLRKIQKFALW